MRLKSPYNPITDFLSSQSYKHRSSQGNESPVNQSKLIPTVIKHRWQIQSPLSSGSFGYIYQGKNLLTHEQVAIKFEPKSSAHPQLARESRIYRSIEGLGMPKMYWYANELHFFFFLVLHVLFIRYGSVNDYHAMILEMLGPSIEDLFHYCQRQFTIKTVLLLAEQMLERICHVHRRCVLHRE